MAAELFQMTCRSGLRRREARLYAGGRCEPKRRWSERSVYTGSGRRRIADGRDADAEYAQGCKTEARHQLDLTYDLRRISIGRQQDGPLSATAKTLNTRLSGSQAKQVRLRTSSRRSNVTTAACSQRRRGRSSRTNSATCSGIYRHVRTSLT